MKQKNIREKGKLKFSRYFQELNEGDRVSIVRELSLKANFPGRFQGRTGVVEKKRGRAYIVIVKDNDKEKRFIIEPIHLKKIENIKENDKK
ncbi:50S ribosomal protein L21e [Candidatus Pacearchaeota archaeon]|nr:50S ribosomal protein L21e [Candidatus Pacearchaeota archaeon]